MVTDRLKEWLRGHFGLATGPDDDEHATELVSRAILGGELSIAKYCNLADPGPLRLPIPLTPTMRTWVRGHYDLPETAGDDEIEKHLLEALAKNEITSDKFQEVAKRGGSDFTIPPHVQKEIDDCVEREMEQVLTTKTFSGKANKMASLSSMFMGSAAKAQQQGGDRIRVRDSSESYSQKRETGLHVKTGREVRPAFMEGKAVETPSEWDFARAGAYLKWTARRSGLNVAWNEHDQNVMESIVENDEWGGLCGDQWKTGLRGAQVKAIINDSGSGGLDINPIWYDQAVVTFPLLHGELFPFVNVVDVPRSSVINSAAVNNPTVIWSTTEGVSQDLFDTSGLIAPLAHTIFPVAVFVEIGLDLLSDSIVNLGQILTNIIGERFQTELDRVIANGNGTTEPEGIFTASAGNIVDSENGTAGPVAMEDAERLLFGIQKQYRTPAWSPSYVLNDATYRRFRQIPVATNWNLRAMGLAEQEYSLIGCPCRIQNDIPETHAAFLPLQKYRVYRRVGMSIRWSSEGEMLMRRNCTLLAVRARYGGFLTDTSSVCVINDMPVVG